MAGTALPAPHHQAVDTARDIGRELLLVLTMSSHTKHSSIAQALPRTSPP
jgi:hypothetical protein